MMRMALRLPLSISLIYKNMRQGVFIEYIISLVLDFQFQEYNIQNSVFDNLNYLEKYIVYDSEDALMLNEIINN